MQMRTEEIWETFSQQLKQFILKRVNDESKAEDILQDVFLKIHLKIGMLKDERKLESWLYQITRNAIIDYYRSQRIMVELPNTLPASGSEELIADLQDTTRNELSQSLKIMINNLPPLYREPLILTEFKGLTQKEMSEQLGLSLPAAKSRVQRGKSKLRDMFLECCHFEFDRLGKVIDYQPKCDCCLDCNERSI